MKYNNERMLLTATQVLIERLEEMRGQINQELAGVEDAGLETETIRATDEAFSNWVRCRNDVVEEWHDEEQLLRLTFHDQETE